MSKLELTLREDGTIVILLPGAQGACQRFVICPDDALGATVRRILEAQANGEAELGLDGAPTSQQVEHWTKHGTFAKQTCRWCIAEGRAHAHRASARVRREVLDRRADGTVIQVRRLTEAGRVEISIDELFGEE